MCADNWNNSCSLNGGLACQSEVAGDPGKEEGVGTLFSTLDIARSGLQVAQVQVDIAGHNIANVNKEGFSRQRAELVARSPISFPFGVLGRGVEVQAINRIRDEFLDNAFRLQVPRLGGAEVQAQYFAQIEDAFLEPGETGFGTRLDVFFDVLHDFANNVESLPVRESVLAESQALAGSLHDLAERFNVLRTNANEEVRNLIPEINSLGEQIASLNVQIRGIEASGTQANDLRDERDVLVDELARLINITARERDNGEIDVLIGEDVFVNGEVSRQLAAVPNVALDPERGDLVEVRFADNNALVDIRDGHIYGALNIRDSVLVEVDGRLDELAGALIREINRIHSQGNGLANLSGTLSSTNPVTAAAVPLGSAGLPFAVSPGTFDVIVYDASGTPTTTTITITAATTLNDLAASLAAVPNFSASVVGGNTLQLGTAAPFTFSFANDSSGALTALGINGLFTGSDARTIAVSQHLLDDPSLLTSAFSSDVLNTGDNTAALALADLRQALVIDGNTASFNDFYETTIIRIGVDARANLQLRDVEQAFVNNFERRRQEVSGVSLDEEITFMIQFQRAFEASARVINVVDRMLDVLMQVGL
jgi:flagellar hook-associated protein 1 FlgK